jgi:anti-sigma factor RsiW
MNDPVYQELVQIALRRELTAAEQARLEACLAAQPQGREAWEEDRCLNQLLRGLPNAPLSSNFTAQVRQAVQHVHTRSHRPRAHRSWRTWLSSVGHAWQFGTALLVLGVGVMLHQHYRTQARSELAHSVVNLPDVASLPSLEVLEDFDHIMSLPTPSAASDEELLSALK